MDNLSAWEVRRKIAFQFQFREYLRHVLQCTSILIGGKWYFSVPSRDGLVLVLLGTVQIVNESSTDLKAFISTSS